MKGLRVVCPTSLGKKKYSFFSLNKEPEMYKYQYPTAVWRSVFLSLYHCILNVNSIKSHFFPASTRRHEQRCYDVVLVFWRYINVHTTYVLTSCTGCIQGVSTCYVHGNKNFELSNKTWSLNVGYVLPKSSQFLFDWTSHRFFCLTFLWCWKLKI